jgi:hypothetical protein
MEIRFPCLSFSITFVKLRKPGISFVKSVFPSVRTKQLGFHTGDFNDIRYLSIFRKCTFDWNPTRIKSTLHEDVCMFMTISL